MIWAEIDWNLCVACNPCPAVRACTMHAIVKIAADEQAFIELDRCHGCGKCLEACSFHAIHLVHLNKNASQSQTRKLD